MVTNAKKVSNKTKDDDQYLRTTKLWNITLYHAKIEAAKRNMSMVQFMDILMVDYLTEQVNADTIKNSKKQ